MKNSWDVTFTVTIIVTILIIITIITVVHRFLDGLVALDRFSTLYCQCGPTEVSYHDTGKGLPNDGIDELGSPRRRLGMNQQR